MRDPATFTPAQRKNVNRDEAGVIVTAREQASKEMRTSHHPGLLQDAILDACVWVDSLEGDYKITSISTPRTIAQDVKGRPSVDTLGRIVLPVEHHILGRIGRLDLLERRRVTSERGQMSNQRGRVRKPAA